MNNSIRIRIADNSDLEVLSALPVHSTSEQQLAVHILDRCVLMAEGRSTEGKSQVIASIGIDLDRKEISDFFLDSAHSASGLGTRMLSEAEKLAIRFGIRELQFNAPERYTRLLLSCGYRSGSSQQETGQAAADNKLLSMQRSFPRRQTRYSRQISKRLSELGITHDYGRIRRMPLQEEAVRLRSIGADIYGREQKMQASAARAWQAMQQQAAEDSIEIQAVSAFRSVDYQAGIIKRKLDSGQDMEEILEVSAAPGFSEHHTGRAIDLTSPGYPVLEQSFDTSPAFEWLQNKAPGFNFRMSFPRDNRHGVAYEPWHWAWVRSGF